MTSKGDLRRLDVGAVRQRARRGIAERRVGPNRGLISAERLPEAVRLHLNSGGNAIAAEAALVRAGYVVAQDPDWDQWASNQYGVKLLVTIPTPAVFSEQETKERARGAVQ